MNCPINEQTADGYTCGRCCFHLPDGVTCPRHGEVATEVDHFRATGRLTLENTMQARLAAAATVVRPMTVYDVVQIAVLDPDGPLPQNSRTRVEFWSDRAFAEKRCWILNEKRVLYDHCFLVEEHSEESPDRAK
ncbi:hypothetical protein LCGC14_1326850, partial [marine sediment metagenome]